MTEQPDKQQYLNYALKNVLAGARRFQDFNQIIVHIKPVPMLQAGDGNVMPEGCCRVDWDFIGERFVEELRKLGIHCLLQFSPNTYSGNVMAHVAWDTDVELNLCNYAVPWYVTWVSRNGGYSPDVAEILYRLAFDSRASRYVYRGEAGCYPSVRSTLSRKLDSTSQMVLSSSSKHDVRLAKSRLRADADESSIMFAMQHLGGDTNTLDFTTDVWVSLYFACTGDEHASDTGRVWALDHTISYSDLTIHRPNLDTLEKIDARRRPEAQCGVLITPDTGIVQPVHLREVARIPPEHKPEILSFLNDIGVSNKTLFSDMPGFIEQEQDEKVMHESSFFHYLAERLQNGRVEDVLEHVSLNIREQTTRKISPEGIRGLLYFRGLAHVYAGLLTRAISDLKDSRELFEKVPYYVDTNLSVLEEKRAQLISEGKEWAVKRPSNRIRKQIVDELTMDIDEALWTNPPKVLGHTYRSTERGEPTQEELLQKILDYGPRRCICCGVGLRQVDYHSNSVWNKIGVYYCQLCIQNFHCVWNHENCPCTHDSELMEQHHADRTQR